MARAIDRARAGGHVYDAEGAVWLRSSALGDDKDRVLVRSDGTYTYVAGDLAYIADKLDRGFDTAVYVLGADHHGYIGRLKAAAQTLGYDPARVDVQIYQLVRLSVMCRHTVGLNYVAIGIEHVGTSDREILEDPKQMRASLELSAWLVDRFHLRLRNVIGHNESLSSPYHKELYKPWAHQTHADWRHADMRIYRAKLRALLRQDAGL